MAAPNRPPMLKKLSSMRPPSYRQPLSRAPSVAPSLNGRASPADSIRSASTSRHRSPTAGVKRKERDFENEAASETNINVVVRCRGRSDREVRENSGVVVSTDGVKGKTVDLSMGPSALSNKTYNFDKVFSPAADQGMVFDEVVAPILDEVLSGFNCTIFAYGQTGTGKTYTMSGDISDVLPLPDDAGIIPRVLYSLFNKLEQDEFENSVKCSFIELYNEELRDLLSAEDGTKLKIFDDNTRKSHSATMVQGMEESHIKNAGKGIQLLREGSHKRQVAATKCNDLSSRSHTIFTITVYMKRPSETGEDYVSAGKLNLVDLAGSENIQRSGAENKRATEAGLINKSLLTLGRVINALVEKSSHIPYRESKLTRLLQDSLGGRTKTCIIATLSPAKSNLEETISTLDYAFRAKNIKNKPQINSTVSKKTLLKEFTAEIERLKGELIATRQRNGVYLTQESYEEITTESESRRILSEEQRDKIETMEANLRNKVQDLFTLTTNFNVLKKDNEAVRMHLDGTKSILEKTEIVLEHTRQNLAEEAALRRAHQKTEEELAMLGENMISTLGKTTEDIGGLYAKLRRRSDLQSMNRQNWHSTQSKVTDTTASIETHLSELQNQQEQLITGVSNRMQEFVQQELQELQSSQDLLKQKMQSYEASEREVNEQTAKSKEEMNAVLEEIKILREDVKEKVGAGLNDLSAAAQRISAGIAKELEAFQTQLHNSYSTIGKEFKLSYDELTKRLNDQHAESERLRQQIVKADLALVESSKTAQSQIGSVIEEERLRATEERQHLLAQMSALINASAEGQEMRLKSRLMTVQEGIGSAAIEYNTEHDAYNAGMDTWSEQAQATIADVVKSRDSMKAKVRADYATANEHTATLQATTKSVHDSTVSIVDAQKAQMDTQLISFDHIESRIRQQNDAHHMSHTSSLRTLASTVQSSYDNIGEHFTTSFARIQGLESDMSAQTDAVRSTMAAFTPEADIRTRLRDLREEVEGQNLVEYAPTGQTPARVQYTYPSVLPRTEQHDNLLTRLRTQRDPNSPLPEYQKSPSKGMVFTDAPTPPSSTSPASTPTTSSLTTTTLPLAAPTIPLARPASANSAISTKDTTLRSLDINTLAPPSPERPASKSAFGASLSSSMLQPPLKRQNTNSNPSANTDLLAKSVGGGPESKLPTKRSTRVTVAGQVAMGEKDRENLPGAGFSASVGPGTGGGRRLRSSRE